MRRHGRRRPRRQTLPTRAHAGAPRRWPGRSPRPPLDRRRDQRQHRRRRPGPALPAGAVRRPRGTAALLVRTFDDRRQGKRRRRGRSRRPRSRRTAQGGRPDLRHGPLAGTPAAPTRGSSCSRRSGWPGSATRRCCSCCAPGTQPGHDGRRRGPHRAASPRRPCPASRASGPPTSTGRPACSAAAVDGLCGLPDAGACAGPSRGTPSRPPCRSGQVPGMLGEVDLPPVTGVVRRWVGTEPRRAVTNVAATQLRPGRLQRRRR